MWLGFRRPRSCRAFSCMKSWSLVPPQPTVFQALVMGAGVGKWSRGFGAAGFSDLACRKPSLSRLLSSLLPDGVRLEEPAARMLVDLGSVDIISFMPSSTVSSVRGLRTFLMELCRIPAFVLCFSGLTSSELDAGFGAQRLLQVLLQVGGLGQGL